MKAINEIILGLIFILCMMAYAVAEANPRLEELSAEYLNYCEGKEIYADVEAVCIKNTKRVPVNDPNEPHAPGQLACTAIDKSLKLLRDGAVEQAHTYEVCGLQTIRESEGFFNHLVVGASLSLAKAYREYLKSPLFIAYIDKNSPEDVTEKQREELIKASRSHVLEYALRHEATALYASKQIEDFESHSWNRDGVLDSRASLASEEARKSQGKPADQHVRILRRVFSDQHDIVMESIENGTQSSLARSYRVTREISSYFKADYVDRFTGPKSRQKRGATPADIVWYGGPSVPDTKTVKMNKINDALRPWEKLTTVLEEKSELTAQGTFTLASAYMERANLYRVSGRKNTAQKFRQKALQVVSQLEPGAQEMSAEALEVIWNSDYKK